MLTFNLTTPQRNIWNLQKYYENTSIANICGSVIYNVNYDYNTLNNAVNAVIASQEALRLRIGVNKGNVEQYSATAEHEDFLYLKFQDADELKLHAYELARTPMDLINQKLYHIEIICLNGKNGILVCLNHLIADAWSFAILARMVEQYCISFVNKQDYRYSSFVESECSYLSSKRYIKDKEFWENTFRDKVEVCSIKPETSPAVTPSADKYTLEIGQTLSDQIKFFCEDNAYSAAVLFEGALFTYLERVNPEYKELVIGNAVLNRSTVVEKATAGMFISTLPLKISVSHDMIISELLKHITETHAKVFRHQKYPFSQIAEYVRNEHGINNLYQVMFSYQNAKTEINAVTEWYSNGYSEVPFVLHVDDRDSTSEYTLTVDYQTEIFKQEEIEYICKRLLFIITQIIATPALPLAEINIIPSEEYQKLIYDFNDTAVDYPRDKCVHELFTEQAKKTPDKTALIFENRKFTYRQLDEMSNSLAHYLREEAGVKPNDIVPIIAKRSWHIIVAMLGILKAGGAYMPVDTSLPKERIELMLNETRANIAVTFGVDLALCSRSIPLETFDYSYITNNITNANYPDDLCYVLFTSGSTGKPKGTAIAHKNLGNFVNNNNMYQCAMISCCDTVIGLSTFSFDISVFEVFFTLANNLTLVLANEEEVMSSSKIAKLINKYNVDVIHSTPTKMLVYLEKSEFQRCLKAVKMLMIGAESFTQEIYNKIRKYTDAVIYNGYGPTETTIGVSFKRIERTHHDVCIHSLFAEQVEKSPEKTALVFENRIFTYKQLDEMSNSLAHYLRDEMGIRQNDIVPIIAKRSWHIIVAMLGILKAGGAYMPVDPTYPVDRILYMMSDARSAFALTYGFENSEVCCMNLEEFNYSSNILPIQSINTINDLCYLIFTSGSTGKPKGVKITHANAANYVNNNSNNNVVNKIIKSRYKSIVSVTNIIFDIFVTESLMPLANGLTIYLANDEEVSSQRSLARLVMRSDKIDVMQTTPTKMRGYMLDENNLEYLKSFKAIILGGEALTSDLASELKACTDAEIFNIYGPAETTVWTTNTAVNPVDITIGKPIANTQIYILDRNRKPLPIGVAGELCISGDSVGKGYLNNTELTLEKFVPNPFIEGKTMYCTGDLARWRADGEIEYLGRIDTQVKIRGLRIELGEIESVMSSFEGISLCAVTDKRDENNRQYLVGYYTADTQIDEKALRKHLSDKLPKYMIPNYFVRLDAMPMTASGKTDRKNMPLPDFSLCKGEYVAPRNETEQKLCALMSELLNIENVGITDDFFDLGGDSLGAMTFIAEAHNEGIEISLQDLYDYPTIESLLDKSKTSIDYSAEQFAKYEEILQRNKTGEESFSKESLGNVLLTGATGFLGSHVLDVLMKQESGKVFCLVRSKEKFIDTLHYYFEELYDDNDRIIPVEGDITDGHLSDILPCDVHTIIHTAANVKHYGAYSEFMKVNVGGTKNLIEYAKSIHAKLIHISTISVSGNTFADAFTAYRAEKEMQFDEGCLYIGQSLENVYVRSKFEAECAVLDAILDGLDARIIRIGNLTNRSSDYKFQPNHENNAFLTRVCAGLKLGVLPDYLLPLYAEFSPVDDTAEGIVRIAQYARKQTIFHLNSNRPIYFTRLIEILHELGIKMETVSGNEFGKRLEEMNHESNTQYLYKAFQNDIDKEGNLTYDSNIRILNDITVNFLNATGFEWTDIDLDYIKGYIEYFRKIGILEV